ncbi:Clathrin heavy chain [Paraconiothyrium brasiliense]|uniref:Clathrin heavy chain n=1 Tax=Paraconiothyrium brasiliense TaxID=300254 RepID=A0ABR3QV09_9PLEO
MMTDAWEHQSFKDTITKASNVEIYYRALGFYLEEQPTLLTDLLQALTARIDVNRVVRMFLKSDNIPLIKPFLLSVQSQNKREVNNALNDLLIEEEDYKTLRDSVNNYDNYDAMDLAQRLERHDLVFFRQIAANIYRKNKRWEKSIALSKQDKLFKDAIETAALSGKTDVVEDLLRYFVDIGSRECYVGMLYACYDLIRPDVILEISWRNNLNDFTMVGVLFRITYTNTNVSVALHDQLPCATSSNDRAAQEGQRRAQATRGLSAEEGGRHADPWLAPHAYARPYRKRSLAWSLPATQRHCASAHGLPRILSLSLPCEISR